MKQKKSTAENPVKKDIAVTANNEGAMDGSVLFEYVASIIENRKARAESHVTAEITLMYWEIGQYIHSVILDGERGEYGKQVVVTLARQLEQKYGSPFGVRNLRRMVQFAARFPDLEIVSPLATQLSWSHVVELLPIESDEAFMYYAQDAITRHLGKRELRHQIDCKAYERREIANSNLTDESSIPFNVFKDPYIIDTLGLRENFSEADLEKAILTEIEAFILEFGNGFAFVERQKRMIVGGEDVILDLLFYNREVQRLVAVELKIGRFKAAYKGQMELYLNWLNENERKPNEESPIGIILCATANCETVELLRMDRTGIAVAEYWTTLPPKALFEEKIRVILAEAQERLSRRHLNLKKLSKSKSIIFMNPRMTLMNSIGIWQKTTTWEQRKAADKMFVKEESKNDIQQRI